MSQQNERNHQFRFRAPLILKGNLKKPFDLILGSILSVQNLQTYYYQKKKLHYYYQ